MKEDPKHIVDFILRYRFPILALITLITILSILQLRSLEQYDGFDIWMEKSGLEHSSYMEFRSDFGSDESIVIYYHSGSLFSNSGLDLIYRFSDSLRSIEGVKKVISLATIRNPFPLIPRSSGSIEDLRERLLNSEILKNNFLSSDGLCTTFTVLLDTSGSRSEVLDEVKSISGENLRTDGEFVLYGITPMKEELKRLSTKESLKFLSFSIVIMLLLNLLLFSRVVEAIVPVFIALLTITWSLGLLSLLNIKMNVVLSILPIIILVISIANSIHFISDLARSEDKSKFRRLAIVSTFKGIGLNCFFSALTTAIALSVFSISSIRPLAHFGAIAAFGVIISFLLTFTILPILYSQRRIPLHRPGLFRKNFPERICSSVNRLRKPILIISTLIFVASIIGISRLKFNTDQITYFKKDNPIRISSTRAGEWFTGVFPVEIILKSEKSFLENPLSSLDLLEEIENVLSKIDYVASVTSPSGFYKNLNRKNIDTEAGQSIVRNIVSSNDLASYYISDDEKRLRLTAKTRWLNDAEALELITQIEMGLDGILQSRSIDYVITGTGPMYARMSQRLVKSQTRSMGLAFILIMLVFLAIYRKLRFALLCLIPNILPVLGTMGIMGFLGIPIDVTTVLLASISLGIAIDDTIHFVGSYKKFTDSNSNYDSVVEALKKVGRPLASTTIILICGFIIMAFSSYRPIMFMGLFISLNVLLALVYDLILLPAILLSKK